MTLSVLSPRPGSPFTKHRPLSPGDPAHFRLGGSGGVGEDRSVVLAEALRCVPKVICSPRKTGKTTLLNQLRSDQREMLSHEPHQESFEIVPAAGMGQVDLRDSIAKLFQSGHAGSLLEILEESRVRQRGGRWALIVKDADSLDDGALRWLLASVRDLSLDPALTAKLQVQLIIDGSFNVDTLTSPDSEFYVPQSFPRELTRGEQVAFVTKRFDACNVAPTAGALESLWRLTRGDKYWTQAICLEIARDVGGARRRRRASEDHVMSVADGLIEATPCRDELARDILVGLAELSEDIPGGPRELKRVLQEPTDDFWASLEKPLKAVAYRSGIVRRIGERSTEVRPFVPELFESAERRGRPARQMLQSMLSLDGVDPRFRPTAEDCFRRIRRAAYLGILRSLHAGVGVRRGENQVVLTEARALGHGSYSGTWDVQGYGQEMQTEELWCLLWSWDEAPGTRKSELRVFPAIPA